MNNDGHTRQLGGNPTNGPRLGGMGMDDIRPLTSEEPHQLTQGDEVVTWVDLATQLRQEHRLDPLLGSEIAKRPLVWPLLPHHQHRLVPTCTQAMREEDDMDPWTTNVQTTDDPTNAGRTTHAV